MPSCEPRGALAEDEDVRTYLNWQGRLITGWAVPGLATPLSPPPPSPLSHSELLFAPAHFADLGELLCSMSPPSASIKCHFDDLLLRRTPSELAMLQGGLRS